MALAILGALIEIDRPATIAEIIAASGYEEGSVRRVVIPLRRWGLVDKPFLGRYIIAERGKIALAIEVGRRTKSRGRGLAVVTQSFSSFERVAA